MEEEANSAKKFYEKLESLDVFKISISNGFTLLKFSNRKAEVLHIDMAMEVYSNNIYDYFIIISKAY